MHPQASFFFQEKKTNCNTKLYMLSFGRFSPERFIFPFCCFFCSHRNYMQCFRHVGVHTHTHNLPATQCVLARTLCLFLHTSTKKFMPNTKQESLTFGVKMGHIFVWVPLHPFVCLFWKENWLCIETPKNPLRYKGSAGQCWWIFHWTQNTAFPISSKKKKKQTKKTRCFSVAPPNTFCEAQEHVWSMDQILTL